MTPPDGHLVLFLHAHLPFVRHPEHEDFLEEDWLYEAITETYLPLLLVAEGWARDGLAARVGASLSPTLVAMLQDDLLMARYRRRLGRLVDVAARQARGPEAPLAAAARAAHAHLEGLADAFEGRLGGDLVAAFRRLEAAGALELATCVAAHAFLPLYAVEPGDARGHVRAAARAHRAAFGRHPPGVWLPECGYVPGLDRLLADEGLLYFFVDAHGALLADPPAALGVHAPLVCPSGVLAFPRDPDASRAVWSAESGYPGDPRYREFYRDQGFELPEAELQGLLLPTGERRGLGLKYHRITGRDVPLGEKAPYAPAEAEAAVRAHAAHFVAARQAQASAFAARHHRPAVLTAPFDAELFGHWWFEGPAFLDQVVRGAAATSSLAVSSPGQVIRGAGPFQLATPAASSWGRAGYGEVWLNEANDWVWPPLHRAARRTRALAQRHRGAQVVLQRALKQLARELLLASASDWPFMMTMGTTVSYAEARVRAHLARHEALADQLEAGQVDEAALAAVEAQDNLLEDIDFEDFA